VTVGKKGSMKQAARKIFAQHWPITILILINIVIGLVVVRDYGQSYDEQSIYRYTDYVLRAYPNFIKTGNYPYLGDTGLDVYGPAFFIFSAILAKTLKIFMPIWSLTDGWHYAVFVSFQISIVSLYFLCKKWMGTWASFGAALLFSVQPLLWGNAFINPKDIPFMAFFLTSITLGFYMIDSVTSLAINPEAFHSLFGPSPNTFRREWDKASGRLKTLVITLLTVTILILIFLTTGLLNQLAAMIVVYVYQADKLSILGAWFARLAPNASHLAVGSYIHKTQAILSRIVLLSLFICLLIGIWALTFVFPDVYKELKKILFTPIIKGIVFNPLVVLAGITLGIATSIRVLGPLAGAIVVLYGFYKCRGRIVLFLPYYLLLAFLACYLTWPYLWSDPINRFVESLVTMARYPWKGLILFRGQLVSGKDLPNYFIPYMMSIQLTVGTLLLFIIGFALSIRDFFRNRRVEPFPLIIVWLILPICGVVAYKSTVYDGFRQFLFILPPVFFAAGLALDALFGKVKKSYDKALILCLFIIPGIYTNIHLHPYQYIFYNNLVGGTRGAFRNYELDYWGISYKEAAQYINDVAPVGAKVVVLGPLQIFREYSRPDLILSALSDVSATAAYDYLVVNSRKNEDRALCRNVEAVKTIERDGAILTTIKRISPPVKCIQFP
jgi:hypothetical protein